MKDVDGRDKPGHDEAFHASALKWGEAPMPWAMVLNELVRRLPEAREL
jgi:hypothetical protein